LSNQISLIGIPLFCTGAFISSWIVFAHRKNSILPFYGSQGTATLQFFFFAGLKTVVSMCCSCGTFLPGSEIKRNLTTKPVILSLNQTFLKNQGQHLIFLPNYFVNSIPGFQLAN